MGLVALLGFPPFSLFVSELTMMRGEMANHLAWAVGLSLVALAIAFAGLATMGRRLLLVVLPGQATGLATPWRAMAPLVVGLSLCASIGIFAWPFDGILHAAARLVTS